MGCFAHNDLSEGPVDLSIGRLLWTDAAGGSVAHELSMARRLVGVGGAGRRRCERAKHPEARKYENSQATSHRISPCCGQAATFPTLTRKTTSVNGQKALAAAALRE